MSWISAAIAIIKAIPELVKLVMALYNQAQRRKAEKDWDDFEDRFKKGVEGEK